MELIISIYFGGIYMAISAHIFLTFSVASCTTTFITPLPTLLTPSQTQNEIINTDQQTPIAVRAAVIIMQSGSSKWPRLDERTVVGATVQTPRGQIREEV